jgi:hypothetical protein
MAPRGAVAEWLGRGLQSLVQRFESARRLFGLALQGFFFGLSGYFFPTPPDLFHRLDRLGYVIDDEVNQVGRPNYAEGVTATHGEPAPIFRHSIGCSLAAAACAATFAVYAIGAAYEGSASRTLLAVLLVAAGTLLSVARLTPGS